MFLKFFLFFILSFSCLFADVYYARLEPLKSYNVKSSVNGIIASVEQQFEGLFVKKQSIIKIDTKIDLIDLKTTKNKLKNINQIIKLEESKYNSLRRIKSKSKFDKYNQKIKVLNLKNQKNDLVLRLRKLENTIKNKTIIVKDLYIHHIYAKEKDYAKVGLLLFEAYDTSKGKLEFFVPIDKKNDIKNKKIYLDDKLTNYKISKIYKIADKSMLSSSKVQILIDKPKNFSKLIKIELKDK
jgi:hypothetical protein